MRGGGFYKGTSTEQTPYFGDKEKKLMEKIVWPEIYNKKIDVNKINFPLIEEWINKRLIEILGFEDDILYEYCISQLKQSKDKKADGEEDKYLNAKKLKINLTGFIGNKKSDIFIEELLELLINEEKNEGHIANTINENKTNEIKQVKNENENIKKNLNNENKDISNKDKEHVRHHKEHDINNI
ncbi:putative pre-mRNA splicing factor, partial [Plasmodium gaboni]